MNDYTPMSIIDYLAAVVYYMETKYEYNKILVINQAKIDKCQRHYQKLMKSKEEVQNRSASDAAAQQDNHVSIASIIGPFAAASAVFILGIVVLAVCMVKQLSTALMALCVGPCLGLFYFFCSKGVVNIAKLNRKRSAEQFQVSAEQIQYAADQYWKSVSEKTVIPLENENKQVYKELEALDREYGWAKSMESYCTEENCDNKIWKFFEKSCAKSTDYYENWQETGEHEYIISVSVINCLYDTAEDLEKKGLLNHSEMQRNMDMIITWARASCIKHARQEEEARRITEQYEAERMARIERDEAEQRRKEEFEELKRHNAAMEAQAERLSEAAEKARREVEDIHWQQMYEYYKRKSE